ncbi:hypothetical protein YNSPA_0855 [Salmonella enterica subsp. enterica serovar Paratyphi A str. YN09620]|nr:hypothetical protein GXSPA_0852 [Salmonella enterica subsp. enterica serovar Paratyphi A str. GXS2268]EPE49622.1 hypothetical protein JXSPA_0848 [Salmonella enterica subsp. enterica serovar Paratyphi A str. JX05-19]EPE51287.1 hypothetical protein GZSPA_0849 [Salmonella enterica subsp. enterica serovar Paratyphi A str. GZ9A00052]EPE57526.1 hypothetical protein ZJSPA_0859 [Salmonella enterica subsp. enterica serovar Paratyphi A str. ZJ98-53]EPE59678.1 hypothetical protein YNSPA_0855 [Salmonell
MFILLKLPYLKGLSYDLKQCFINQKKYNIFYLSNSYKNDIPKIISDEKITQLKM